jgi:aryl-alcohol dehydrogenase-like predicted oxidoreductase
MEERNVGKSGLLVSAVGLGCNNFGARVDRETSLTVIRKALDEGITLFDTADVYGERRSETIVGEALGPRRKDIVLATKFGMAMDDAGKLKGGSRRYIMSAVEASLKRLNTDWIDLYQYHRPDPLTPLDETMRALDDLVRQGKVRYVGCSNMPAWQVVEAQWIARSENLAASFICCQDEYSLLVRGAERDLFPAMKSHGLGLLPYYPLASGLLTGKYKRGEPLPEGSRLAKGKMFADRNLTDTNWDRTEKLRAFVEKRGRSLLELAFSWIAMQSPVSSVIAGATKPEQVTANVKAVGWKLSAEDLAEIDRITG